MRRLDSVPDDSGECFLARREKMWPSNVVWQLWLAKFWLAKFWLAKFWLAKCWLAASSRQEDSKVLSS